MFEEIIIIETDVDIDVELSSVKCSSTCTGPAQNLAVGCDRLVCC